ncbi:MAG: (Fe-S)-binding protein [bacterium]
MYFTFISIYLLGWTITLIFIIQKINHLKLTYQNITQKPPNPIKLTNLNLNNLIEHIIIQSRISNFRTKFMHTSISSIGFFYFLSPLLIFFPFILQLLLDITLTLSIIGILLAIARRYILKVPRIIISSTKERYLKSHLQLLLLILSTIAFFYFSFEPTTPLLYSISTYLKIPTPNLYLQIPLGIIWLGMIYVYFSNIDKGRLYHTLLAPMNILLTNPKDFSLDFVNVENTDKLGIAKANDLNFKELLEVYSCTECGRCQEACPAFNSKQPLSPKSILVRMLDHIQDYQLDNKKQTLDYISEKSIWSCTTCGACYQACPVLINPMQKIIQLRRNLVMEQGQIPHQLQDTLNSIETRNHPFKGSNIERLSWINKNSISQFIQIIEPEKNQDNIDYIYWVGCAISYNEQIQSIALKLVKILSQCQIRVGILKNEICTGDPAKRIGNEYLFYLQAQKNIETLSKLNKKIITTCPHCYNSIKNEYPKVDPTFKAQIYHHSQIIADLIKQKKLKIKKLNQDITFHDPCYLARQNNIINQPREVLKSYNLKEMKYNKTNSFCCGAGGGMYWIENKDYPKINHSRLEQALQVSKNIATACPFCTLMLQDAVNTKGLKNQVIVKDITEWIELVE